MGASSGETSADHLDELVQARLDGLRAGLGHDGVFALLGGLSGVGVDVHSPDLGPVEDTTLVHLATHLDEEVVRRFARALVRLLRVEDGFGEERREVVQCRCGEEVDEGGEERSAVLWNFKESVPASYEGRKTELTRFAPLATLPPRSTSASTTSPAFSACPSPPRTPASTRRFKILYPRFCTP